MSAIKKVSEIEYNLMVGFKTQILNNVSMQQYINISILQYNN